MDISQAKSLSPGQRLHYTFQHPCSRTVGPRGGITTDIMEVRVTGVVQRWKTDPTRIRVPIKYGLYVHAYITEDNLQDFHLPEDCPLPPLVLIAPPLQEDDPLSTDSTPSA